MWFWKSPYNVIFLSLCIFLPHFLLIHLFWSVYIAVLYANLLCVLILFLEGCNLHLVLFFTFIFLYFCKSIKFLIKPSYSAGFCVGFMLLSSLCRMWPSEATYLVFSIHFYQQGFLSSRTPRGRHWSFRASGGNLIGVLVFSVKSGTYIIFFFLSFSYALVWTSLLPGCELNFSLSYFSTPRT